MKISLPENETTVNLKSASFHVMMLLHEGLIRIQSQIKPRLLFGESFTLSSHICDNHVDIVNETLRHFPGMFVVTKLDILSQDTTYTKPLPSSVCA